MTRRSFTGLAAAALSVLALGSVTRPVRALSFARPPPLQPDPPFIPPADATLSDGDEAARSFAGHTVWNVESGKRDGRPEVVLRADVEIPQRSLEMRLEIYRNSDRSLPVSHLIEVRFARTPDFEPAAIADVPAALTREYRHGRGVPLKGIAVKVMSGFFLIGLSEVEAERSRNVSMLRDRGWLDIELTYASGSRAVLSLEKGEAGASAFEAAFRVWGE